MLLHFEGVTPHTFRHTRATNKIMVGENIKDVAEFIGDTQKAVRDNYEHLAPNYLAHMVDWFSSETHYFPRCTPEFPV